MQVEPAEFARVRDLAAQALAWAADGDAAVELEAALTCGASPLEFAHAVAAVAGLPGAAAAVETLQLDCAGPGGRRWEFAGEERVRAFLRRGGSVGPAADRVLEKRRVAGPVNVGAWPLRVRLKSERQLAVKGASVPPPDQTALRLKRRLSYRFAADGVRVDLTAVVASAESGELRRGREHEVEVEALPAAEQPAGRTADGLAASLLAYAYACLCALRGTSQPVSATEGAALAAARERLAAGGGGAGRGSAAAGPQPVTLTAAHLRPPGPGVVSVLDGYTVTDKADGERRALLVADGTAVLIDSRGGMARAFTGAPAALNGTLLDGELVTRAKVTGTPMRLFAAFDAYYVSGRCVAGLPLMRRGGGDGAPTRLAAARDALAALAAGAAPADGLAAVCKRFWYVGGPAWGAAVAAALAAAEELPYAIDGLIFTPAEAAAGAEPGRSEPRLGGRWSLALKWKPPTHNSIDFLARVKRDRSGAELVRVRQRALPSGASASERLKTVVLHVGYDRGKMEPVDPLDYLTRGAAALPRGGAYVARPFTPGGDAAVSEAELPAGDDGVLRCEDGDALEDGAVVEFGWRAGRGWSPMRVRHDKTERAAAGGPPTCNSWETAASVWASIRAPVTLDMVTGAAPPPPPPDGDDDVYYDGDDAARSRMRAMRDFHNTIVKARLYERYGRRGGALLELACGPGGDMPRWLAAGFATVVGVDKSHTNITSPDPRRGVYARWDKAAGRAKGGARPAAAFLTLDASTRMFAPHDELREAGAASGQLELVEALWGLSARPPAALEPFSGVMARGFDLVSCQFAVHYMFRTPEMLDRFVANVARLTRVGGHFVGTTFDGDTLAAALARGGGELVGRAGGHVHWSITRQYEGAFRGETGRAVDVYVETIGKVAREYLVSFRTLRARLAARGFELAESETFDDAHARAAAAGALPAPLPPVEKALSFMYRSFAFKRVK